MVVYDATRCKSFDGSPLPTYDGAVLGFESKEERIMSDVYAMVRYALVWDGKAISRVSLGNSEFGACASATIDATDEVKAHAFLYLAGIEQHRAECAREAVVNRLVDAAKAPAKGKTVVVSRGRKVPTGTEGEVFWIGNNGYGESVGIVCADGSKHFTASKNVDVVNADDFIDLDFCMERPDFSADAYKIAAKNFYAMVGYLPSKAA